MAEHHQEPNYMGVFWWLLALTILEVVVALLPLEPLVKGILLVGMALAKAILVALYFMHLRFETRTLGLIAFTPLTICVFLILMLMPDVGLIHHEGPTAAVSSSTSH
jgi:cytochrome c oxidase subunit 4